MASITWRVAVHMTTRDCSHSTPHQHPLNFFFFGILSFLPRSILSTQNRHTCIIPSCLHILDRCSHVLNRQTTAVGGVLNHRRLMTGGKGESRGDTIVPALFLSGVTHATATYLGSLRLVPSVNLLQCTRQPRGGSQQPKIKMKWD